MPNKSLSRSGLLTYQKYSSLLAGNNPYIPFTSDYELLETEILTGSQASVTFSSLGDYASDYQHLQVRGAIMTTADTRFWMNLNSDTGSNYSWHRLSGNGSSVGSEGNSSQTGMRLMNSIQPASTSAAGIVIDLLDCYETTKYTTVRALSGSTGSANEVGLFSGSWKDTAAITGITLGLGNTGVGGNDMLTGTRISLYGLRSA